MHQRTVVELVRFSTATEYIPNLIYNFTIATCAAAGAGVKVRQTWIGSCKKPAGRSMGLGMRHQRRRHRRARPLPLLTANRRRVALSTKSDLPCGMFQYARESRALW